MGGGIEVWKVAYKKYSKFAVISIFSSSSQHKEHVSYSYLLVNCKKYQTNYPAKMPKSKQYRLHWKNCTHVLIVTTTKSFYLKGSTIPHWYNNKHHVECKLILNIGMKTYTQQLAWKTYWLYLLMLRNYWNAVSLNLL